MSDETEIKREIHYLENLLDQKKNALFMRRLMNMFDYESMDFDTKIKYPPPTISNIKIFVDTNDNTWNITYTHTTNSYNINDYLYEKSDSDSSDTESLADEPIPDIKPASKITEISFGKHKKYFIKGGIKYTIYRNSSKELRIINSDYDIDLDVDKQFSLVTKYSQNSSIPEWFALSVFLYIAEHKWDDVAVAKHFSII
jgi:hypothetical protein